MALRLLVGPAGSGKTDLMMRELAQKDPMSRNFYIAPEQMTLSSQQKLLEAVPGHGVMNTEVLSFNRLAHRIFEEVGLPAQSVLDDVGKSLLLYRIAGEQRSSLEYYGRSVRQSGFIGQLKLMVTEMLQYCLTEEDIEKMLEAFPKESVLAAKWRDILHLYRCYNEEISERQISSEQLLDYLAERLGGSQTVREAELYFDEFSGFTPQQYKVLRELSRSARRLTVSLSMSERAYYEAQSVSDVRSLSRNVFYETQKSFLKLKAMAAEAGLPLEVVFLDPREGTTADERALVRLRESLFSVSEPVLLPRDQEQQQAVYLSEFNLESDEITALMHEILHLVREEGFRYKDIAILSADFDRQAYPLRRALDLYGLNAYMDVKAPLSAHPFSQLVNGLLSAAAMGWSTADVIGIFKTGLTPLSKEQSDLLENELRAGAVSGAKRLCRLLSAHEDLEEAALLAESLEVFSSSMSENGKTVSERLGCLKELLTKWEVPQRMEARARDAELLAASAASPGPSPAIYLRRTAEYRHLWDKFLELCEKAEGFLGTVQLSARDFGGLISVALSQYELASIPPTADQLLVGDLSVSHLTRASVIFVTGFTESAFPGNTDNPGLFNRKERADMRRLLETAPDSSENVLLRYLSLYTLLGKAGKKVYFSCSRGSSDGSSFTPALQWSRIRKITGAHEWPQRTEPTLPYPSLCEKGLALPETALSWLEENGWKELVASMRKASQNQGREDSLSPRSVRALLKSYQAYSVSQAECYARCPFSYYMRYLLKLKEREEPQVRLLEDGTVLHDVLESSGEWFRKMWELSQNAEETEPIGDAALVGTLFREREENPEYAVYRTTARYRYYWSKLEKSAAEAVGLIRRQLELTGFCPTAFEWEFGDPVKAPFRIPLSDGTEASFCGKIDRIDVLNEQDGSYIRIIDYKSGRTDYNEAKILAGSELQLPIYMEAALGRFDGGSNQAVSALRPAGFFYFHLLPEDEGKAKLNGLMLRDRVILSQMDRTLEPGSTAETIPAGLTNDGEFSTKSGHYATAEQFAALGAFARGKAAESLENIRAGKMQADPLDQACQYCSFKAVCGFDVRRSGEACRSLPKVTDFWAQIGAETERKDDSLINQGEI